MICDSLRSERNSPESPQRVPEQLRVWIPLGKRKQYPAGALPYHNADLEQLHAYSAALGLVMSCSPKPASSQTLKQYAGKGRKVHPQLVRHHVMSGRAVREHIQLLSLDTVLHLSPRAAHILVKSLRVVFPMLKRRHHEPGVGPLFEMFRLAHNPPPARPGFPGTVAEAFESPRGFSGFPAPRMRLADFLADSFSSVLSSWPDPEHLPPRFSRTTP